MNIQPSVWQESPLSFSRIMDTTDGSLIHVPARRLAKFQNGVVEIIFLYLLCVILTFFPLAIGAWVGTELLPIKPQELALPFSRDLSTIFMYLVSLPCIFILVSRDNKILTSALDKVVGDGILRIDPARCMDLVAVWQARFRSINLTAQSLGAISGVVTCFVNVGLDRDLKASGWMGNGGEILLGGYVQLYCNFIFAIVAAAYIIRTVSIIFFLWDFVAKADVCMLPLHPDNAGGLQPIGQLGLRNQYAITLLGVNIWIGYFISHHYIDGNAWWKFIVAAVAAYSVFGPIVFVGPLLPFREGMLKSKAELLNGVALRMRTHLDEIRSRFKHAADDPITEIDEKSIERLRKIGTIISDMPVWPFDAVTLHKFFVAYGLPALSVILTKLIGALNLAW